MALEDEAPQFIDAVLSLAPTHAERASVIGVHENTIIKMATKRKIPKCVARYLPFPHVIAALHRDALAYVANHQDTSTS
jgi:hypothetical protein